MEWILVPLLVWGGYEWGSYDESLEHGAPATVINQQTLVENQTSTYERGKYYKTQQGYYISNLQPKPKKDEGCDRSIIVADLSEPNNAEEKISVTEIQMTCGG